MLLFYDSTFKTFCIRSILNHYSEDFTSPNSSILGFFSVTRSLVYFEFISLSVKYSLVKYYNRPLFILWSFVVLSMISCLLSELKDKCRFLHNLRSTEIHPRITFQIYIFSLIKLSATYHVIFSIFVFSGISPITFFHVIIVDTLSAMYQFDTFLAHSILRKSYNNLALGKQ